MAYPNSVIYFFMQVCLRIRKQKLRTVGKEICTRYLSTKMEPKKKKNDKVRRHIAQKLVVSILNFFLFVTNLSLKFVLKKSFSGLRFFWGRY